MFNIVYQTPMGQRKEMAFFTFPMAAYAVDRLVEDGCKPSVIFGDRDYFTVDGTTITKVSA
jgi:hypothetical protein